MILEIKCVICGNNKRLKFAPLMSGTETKELICPDCYSVWYETKIADKEKLRKYVLSQQNDRP